MKPAACLNPTGAGAQVSASQMTDWRHFCQACIWFGDVLAKTLCSGRSQKPRDWSLLLSQNPQNANVSSDFGIHDFIMRVSLQRSIVHSIFGGFISLRWLLAPRRCGIAR